MSSESDQNFSETVRTIFAELGRDPDIHGIGVLRSITLKRSVFSASLSADHQTNAEKVWDGARSLFREQCVDLGIVEYEEVKTLRRKLFNILGFPFEQAANTEIGREIRAETSSKRNAFLRKAKDQRDAYMNCTRGLEKKEHAKKRSKTGPINRKTGREEPTPVSSDSPETRNSAGEHICAHRHVANFNTSGGVHVESVDNYAPSKSEKRPLYLPRAAGAFVGRTELVDRLAAALQLGTKIAVVGPGGIGKTALCAEALKRLGTNPQNPGPWKAGVFSHDFYSQPTFAMALAGLTRQLGAHIPEKDREEFVRACLDRPDVLLYLEGCERAEFANDSSGALHRVIKLVPNATLLLTSRERQHVAGMHPFEVVAMPTADSAQLLYQHASAGEQLLPLSECRDWEAVAARLGGHPLALRLAGQHLWLERLTLTDLQHIMDKVGFIGFDVQRTEKQNLGWLFDHSAAAVERAHPGSLTAWYTLSLHALAPLPLKPIAASLGVEEDEARARLRGLIMHSLAEVEQMPADTIGQKEPGWRLAHALLGEWGRTELPHRGIDPAAIYERWRDWWIAFMKISFAERCVPGGWQRYVTLVPHLEAVPLGIERHEGENSDSLDLSLIHLGLLNQYHGDFSSAERLLRRALEVHERVLGPDHTNTLISISNLAGLLQAKGDLAGAEQLLRRALGTSERVLGADHPDTLRIIGNLTVVLDSRDDLAGAEPLMRRALEACERVFGPDHPDTLRSVGNLGALLQAKGDLPGAEQLLRRALKVSEQVLGADHPATLTTASNLGVLLKERDDLFKAEPLMRRALEARKRVLGPDHPHTLGSVENLANLLKAKGDLPGAEPFLRCLLDANERMFGVEHPVTLKSVTNLANLLQAMGDLAGAEPLLRRTLDACERTLGSNHPTTLSSVNSLAALCYSRGNLTAAEQLVRRALEASERVVGAEHPHTLIILDNLAYLLKAKGDLAGAELLLRSALETSERVLGVEHANTLTRVNNLAFLLQAKHDLAGAEQLMRRALEASERVVGAEHPHTLIILNNLAFLLQAKGDLVGAEPLLRRTLDARVRVLGGEHPDTLTSVDNLAHFLYSNGNFSEAESVLRQALAALEKTLGTNHPFTLQMANTLEVLLHKQAILALNKTGFIIR